MTPSKDHLRRVMGRFTTGVTIITTRLGDDLHGMTANAVTSLSLDPMLVLVCVDKNADTHDILKQAGIFAVNILGQEQAHISRQFARKDLGFSHGLEGVAHRFSVTGCPIIDGSLAYLDCRTVTEHHGGDHTIFIGEVLDAHEMSDGRPLAFYAGGYGRFVE